MYVAKGLTACISFTLIAEGIFEPDILYPHTRKGTDVANRFRRVT